MLLEAPLPSRVRILSLFSSTGDADRGSAGDGLTGYRDHKTLKKGRAAWAPEFAVFGGLRDASPSHMFKVIYRGCIMRPRRVLWESHHFFRG
jgi:hypothetical protein